MSTYKRRSGQGWFFKEQRQRSVFCFICVVQFDLIKHLVKARKDVGFG